MANVQYHNSSEARLYLRGWLCRDLPCIARPAELNALVRPAMPTCPGFPAASPTFADSSAKVVLGVPKAVIASAASTRVDLDWESLTGLRDGMPFWKSGIEPVGDAAVVLIADGPLIVGISVIPGQKIPNRSARPDGRSTEGEIKIGVAASDCSSGWIANLTNTLESPPVTPERASNTLSLASPAWTVMPMLICQRLLAQTIRLALGPRKRRQQHFREERNGGNYNQRFDQGESRWRLRPSTRFESLPSESLEWEEDHQKARPSWITTRRWLGGLARSFAGRGRNSEGNGKARHAHRRTSYSNRAVPGCYAKSSSGCWDRVSRATASRLE